MKNYKMEQLHFFVFRNVYFVFATESLRLYEVDAVTYAELQEFYTAHGCKSVFTAELNDLLEELLEDQLVVCTEEMISAAVSAPVKQDDPAGRLAYANTPKVVISSLLLQLANDCNLNCVYCYGDGGSYGRPKELMDFETARKGIDLMCEHSDSVRDIHIAFFGGEPLLNFSLMKKVVAYCTEMEQKYDKKFRYNMTTNGTILNNEIYRFLKGHCVSTMISMDGGKEVQDTYRCDENGTGSYDQVVQNLPQFKKIMNDSISVRATVCRPNLNLKKIKDDLYRLGFTNVSLITVDAPENSPLFVGKDSQEELLQRYLELADDYIRCIKEGRGYACYSFDTVLKSLYYKEIRTRSCNAGRNGFALGTDGNLYVCQRFMSMPEYAVGNVSDGIQWEAIQAYMLADVNRKEDCAGCWARYLCGGSCLNTCVTRGGDIMKAPKCYCGIYKGLYEIGLYIYHELKSWNDNVFNDVFKRHEEMLAKQGVSVAP